ncbi:MAG: hypothetical protein WBL27_03260 [Salinimicrobium sp.]
MKKLLLAILFLLLLFIILVYWSVSVHPEEVKISEVIAPEQAQSNIRSLDSVTVIPSNRYEGNGIKRFMQGKNYRRAWSTPVKAPVFILDSMEIVEEGGGHQTHSLRLKAPNNFIYSMRSVNKDPAPLIPDVARDLGLENVIIDGISAQHPLGAILAASLSKKAGVLHTHPQLVYTPKQPALGKFSKDYGDKLYLLEFETEGETNWTNFANVVEIMDTDDLQELKMEEGDKVAIDEHAFVRARLFDLFIGDWDRHAKQWGWVVQKKGDRYMATPLAGDRDNAFFRIDGVIPSIMTNHLVQPLVRPFEEDIDYMEGFVYPVDIYFLRSTPKEVFVEEAQKLQKIFSDEQIKSAFSAWPKQIRELNEQEITEKLKSRRDHLVEYAKAFKKEIDARELVSEPLKGSEDLHLPEKLKKCFNCRQ